jgi:hypothetical protein
MFLVKIFVDIGIEASFSLNRSLYYHRKPKDGNMNKNAEDCKDFKSPDMDGMYRGLRQAD